MNRGLLIMALFAALGIATYHYLQPQGDVMNGGDTIDVIIQNRHMEPQVVRAKEDTTITLEIRTDEPGTVMVENYNISVVTAVGRAVEMTIPASRAGTFPVVMYPSGSRESVQIGTVEVQEPRKGW